jgi:hypothetical protein
VYKHYAIKAHGNCSGKAPCIHDLSAEWNRMISFTFKSTLPLKKWPLMFRQQKAWQTHGKFGCGGGKKYELRPWLTSSWTVTLLDNLS